MYTFFGPLCTSYWTQSNFDMSYSPCDPAGVYVQATLNHLSHVPSIWSFDLPLHDPCLSRVTAVHRICLPIYMHQRVSGLSFLSLLFSLVRKQRNKFKTAFSWDVMPSNTADCYLYGRGTCRIHLKERCLLHTDKTIRC